jgi:V8-like Glu-specific endopeptidase
MSENDRPKQGIVGGDDRFVVPNPTSEPLRYICRIEAVTRIIGSNYEYDLGTGFLITPNVIVTAAHNVWGPGRTYLQFNVGAAAYKPGDLQKMKQFKPDGRIVRIHPRFLKAATPDDLKKKSIRNWDIALITLPRELAFSELRGNMFSYGEQEGGVPSGRCAALGYPGDSKLKMMGAYGHYKGREAAPTSNLVTHDIDTKEGQSGGPILPVKSDGVYGNAIAGMHIAEDRAAGQVVNYALTFSAAITKFIQENTVIPNMD